jgi:predicted RNase H-like HicB family nuclease
MNETLASAGKIADTKGMHNEFTAIFESDGEWIVAYCPEIPGANGQGRSREEARQSLADAIALILEDRREDSLRGLPPDAEKETVVVAA